MTLRALAKPALVAFLALFLFIPVGWIQGLVHERQMRSAYAVAGIAEGWGKRQALAGPYLALPYEHTEVRIVHETVDGRPRERRTEHTTAKVLRIPADAVEWTIGVEVSEKARGIYKARLYGAKLEVRGRLSVPPRFGLAPDTPTIRSRAGTPRLVVGISDPQGIRAVSPLSANDARLAFQPGPGDANVPGGLHVPLPSLGAAQTLEFAFTLELAGSEALAVSPLGADTTVSMRSEWPHPSFAGRFLPLKHDIRPDGFTSEWKISRYAAPGTSPGHELSVGFVEPAGLYQRLERASKYGFLFIGLTFAAFMLCELLRRLAIHPIQYALVGLALAMFFLLLVALSEHIAFTTAYAIATLACVGVITIYLTKVLGNFR
ncbi:MAG TPA: cell envelope integrity protein CreD, partial [Burkholderiales bacterium]|nr:cell envelope integrity protein CreD [Burkholderiales bacterium]